MKKSNSFLQEVVTDFLGKETKNHQWVFVLPSNRAIERLKVHWINEQKKTQTAFLLPKFFTPNDFILSIGGLPLATKAQTVEIFSEVVQMHIHKEMQPEFIKRTEAILEVFREIDSYLLEPKQISHFFESYTLSKLYEQAEKIDVTDLRQCYNFLWNHLETLYRNFVQIFKERLLTTSGMAQRTAVLEIENWMAREKKNIALVGLYAFSEMENKLWEKVAKSSNQLLFYEDADRSYIDHKKHEAGLFFRRYEKENWWKKEQWGRKNLSTAKIEINAIKCQTATHQIDYVLNQLEETFDPSKKIGILFGDLTLIRPFVEKATLREDLNIAIGYPILYTQLMIWWLKVLSPYKGSQTSKITTHFANFLDGLSHLALPDDFTTTFSTKGIENTGDYLEAVLSNPAHQKPEFNSQNQAGIILVELIHEFLLKEKNRDPRFVFQWFKEQIGNRELYYEGSQDSAIQVTGILETRALDYDEFFFISFMEDTYPQKFQYQSLIAFDIRKAYRLPLPEEKEAVYAYNFYRLLHRTQKVHLLHYEQAEQRSISRYFLQLKQEYPTYYPNFKINSFDYKTLEEPLPPVKPIVLEKTAYQKRLLHTFFDNPISASGVLSYYRDYEAFLAQKVFQISSTLEGDAIAMGKLNHRIVELLYQPLIGQSLNPKIIAKTCSKVKEVVQKVILEKTEEGSVDFAYQEKLVGYIQTQIIEKFVKNDLEKLAEENRILVGTEQELTGQLEVPFLEKPLQLHGICDSIDQSADGILNLTDYKSSNDFIEEKLLEETDLESWHLNLLEGKQAYKHLFQLLFYVKLYVDSHPDKSFQKMTVTIKTFEKLKDPKSYNRLEVLPHHLTWFEGLLTHIFWAIWDN